MSRAPVVSSPRLLLALFAALFFIGCGSGDKSSDTAKTGAKKRIILLTNGNSPFWDACRAGLMDANKELKLADAGLEAIMEVNDGTAQGQLDKLRQFGSQTDVAGIAVSVNNAGNVAIADEMRKLKAAGIAIVTVDSDFEASLKDARTAFIGTNNLEAGKELGVCAKALRPAGGQYVTFVGWTDAQNATERVSGFGQGAGDQFKSLDNMGDEVNPTRARDNVRNAIGNHPGLNVLVGIWSYNAPAIVDVVKELNKRSAMTIVVFDAEPLAITGMDEGMIDALMVQNPYQMGFQSARMLKALVTKEDAVIKEMVPDLGQPGGDVYDTGLKVVAPNAESPLTKVKFGPKTDFLLLDAFRDWMKKYNLTSS